MLAQFLAIALIGQCGTFGCGGVSFETASNWTYVDSQSYVNDQSCVNDQSYVQSSVSLVGRSVFCRFRNTGLIKTKTYAKARIWHGNQSGLVNVPIINGYAPSIQWKKDSNGMITTLTCDYGDKVLYKGGDIVYGKEPEKEPKKAQSEEKVNVEELLPVPSQDTTPLPLTGEVKAPEIFAR